ncbi:30S ribosomal protein S11, partial [Mycoplasmopsis synoviae]|uniref:30S ribosomal protein S11 n=1 Tax=Mycoplasmopsis synoviae TaxID=2109 RepID=UPI00387B5219
VRVEMKGLGSGKDSGRKQIEVWGIKVTKIKDVTPISQNLTRPPKRVLKRLRLKK